MKSKLPGWRQLLKRAVLVGTVLTMAGFLESARAQTLINGAGASFPYPLYSKWFDLYTKVEPGIRFNYQSIGSGGGIRQMTTGTVDFGATDSPMTDEQLKRVRGDVLHIPMVIGAVVAIYSLPRSPRLRFTPAVLADIFLGRITQWNDPRIAMVNSDVNLPNQPIIVVRRSDGSGTTYVWADYLSTVSQEWERRVGRGSSVNWPAGLGAKGNEGIAGQVRSTPGALGYVELAYAITNKLPFATVQNRAGKLVEPSIESTAAAAAAMVQHIPPDLRVSLADAPGEAAYPIAGFTWLLIHREQRDELKGRALVRFLWWAIHDGQRHAPDLFYAPLPPQVVNMAEAKIRQITYQGRSLLALR